MRNQRKILYTSSAINFTVGVIIGIILFFGQIKNGNSIENIYEYDKIVSTSDFFRMVLINLIWMFSVIFAHSLLPAKYIHPILVLRGCVNSFALLYIFNFFGMKEAIVSALPQCFTVLPMLITFSSEIAEKSGGFIKRNEAVALLLLSIVSAGAEVLLFRLFCSYLF